MDSKRIEPLKVFVHYIPAETTADEIESFFSSCGNVVTVSFPPKKWPHSYKTHFFCFITFETQKDADRAVADLNGKMFRNKKGDSSPLTVTHSYVNFSAKESSSKCSFEDKRHSQDVKVSSTKNLLKTKQQEQKSCPPTKESKEAEMLNFEKFTTEELLQQFLSNEEKLRQIHHDLPMEQELKDLKMKMIQLQVKKCELEAKVVALKKQNEILCLKEKLQDLDEEQLKIRSGH